jgi:hypothetical protein
MKVKQSPVIEKLRSNPIELKKLFAALRNRNSANPDTVKVDGKTYVIRRSPIVTEHTAY